MVLTKGESVWGALATHTQGGGGGGGGNLSNRKKNNNCVQFKYS